MQSLSDLVLFWTSATTKRNVIQREGPSEYYHLRSRQGGGSNIIRLHKPSGLGRVHQIWVNNAACKAPATKTLLPPSACRNRRDRSKILWLLAVDFPIGSALDSLHLLVLPIVAKSFPSPTNLESGSSWKKCRPLSNLLKKLSWQW